MNSANNTAHQREPSEIELLLPWYAAGTLDPREMRQVEAGARRDPELAEPLRMGARGIRAGNRYQRRSGRAVARRCDDAVRQDRRAAGAADEPVRRISARRIAEFLASLSPRTLAWSAAAAALAIVLQAGCSPASCSRRKALAATRPPRRRRPFRAKAAYVLHPLSAAGDGRRYRALSGNQQAEHCRRPGRRSALSGARRARPSLPKQISRASSLRCRATRSWLSSP